MRILLDGENWKTTDSEGLTALHLSVQQGHISTVRLVLENGASLEGQSSEGLTVLHLAAKDGDTEMIQLPLDNGAKSHLEALDGEDKTPLCWAISDYKLETVKCLLDAGGNINASPKWPAMYAAAYYGQVSIMEELLNRGFDKETWEAFRQNKSTPLHA